MKLPQQALRLEQQIIRAGVSSFGFGGTTAHVIVESFATGHVDQKDNAI